MTELSDQEDLLTRFLLDEASEQERAEVEDRLIADNEFSERVLAAEADLVDAYVRGELPARERARFEEVFLSSSQNREHIEFARGLVKSVTRLHESETRSAKPASARPSGGEGLWARLTGQFAPRPVLGYAFAALLVIVVGLAVWFAIVRMRERQQVGPTQQARSDGAAPQPAPPNGKETQSDSSGNQNQKAATPERKPSPEAQEPRTQPVFAAITLAAGALRDGTAGGNLLIPRGATQARLKLEIETDDYRSYRATITTPEGRRVWTGPAQRDRQKNARSVALTLPAASLNNGDYLIELSGAADGRFHRAAQYSFRVTREE